MSSAWQRLWWRLSGDDARRKVHHSVTHPILGTLDFEGKRSRRDETIGGGWSLVPRGSSHRVVVDFRSMDEPLPDGQRSANPLEDLTPSADDLDRLADILGDPDRLFERCRSKVEGLYAEIVEAQMPADWRATFRLDSLQVPAATPADAEWQVSYWCEDAQHWFVVDLAGDRATGVEMEG